MKRLRRHSIGRIPGYAAILILAGVTAVAAAGDDGTAPPKAHMRIANPADLSGARAESVYQGIRAALARSYGESGDPVTAAYQGWRRYNLVPYRSSRHGGVFVNNYANERAAAYGRFGGQGPMPVGAVIVKDSFVVTRRGDVMTGPLHLMEKKAPGFDPANDDWLYMSLAADGRLVGVSGGLGAENVTFCAECHARAPAASDHLFFMPRDVRRPSR
jgi:hypothetical protein